MKKHCANNSRSNFVRSSHSGSDGISSEASQSIHGELEELQLEAATLKRMVNNLQKDMDTMLSRPGVPENLEDELQQQRLELQAYLAGQDQAELKS